MRNILKDFTINDIKNTGVNGHVYDFSVGCKTIDVSDTGDIQKLLKDVRKKYLKVFKSIRKI